MEGVTFQCAQTSCFTVLLTTLSAAEVIWHRMRWEDYVQWTEEDGKKVIIAYFKVLYQQLIGRAEENCKNPQSGEPVLHGIQIHYLPSTNQDLLLLASMFDHQFLKERQP